MPTTVKATSSEYAPQLDGAVKALIEAIKTNPKASMALVVEGKTAKQLYTPYNGFVKKFNANPSRIVDASIRIINGVHYLTVKPIVQTVPSDALKDKA
jgi:hypothetical protein